MKRTKVILLALLTLFIVIQFIQPARNQGGQVVKADIGKAYPIPEKVQALLKKACYDCHSNDTQYPWYANVQPFGWWMASHIKEGKSELNFNTFGDYSIRKQLSKLKAIVNSVDDGAMPLSSYTLIHRDAKLSNNDKVLIRAWVTKLRDSLSLKH